MDTRKQRRIATSQPRCGAGIAPVLAFCAAWWVLPANAAATYIEFDPPGAAATYPVSVNSLDDVAGYYIDSNGFYHGFIREFSDGKIVTFAAYSPGATFAEAISPKDVIAGYYYKRKNLRGPVRGFVRAADGKIASFNVNKAFRTFATDINGSGVVIGYDFPFNDPPCHGFVRQPDGTVANFDVPGAVCTMPASINKSGDIAGYWNDGYTNHGFVLSSNGTLTEFNVGRSAATLPQSLENGGRIAGYYLTQRGHYGAFLRNTNGKITKFEVPGASDTLAFDSTDQGNGTSDSTGYGESNGTYAGFLRTGDGAITSFEAPDAGTGYQQGTFAQSMTGFDLVAGYYVDGNYVTHGFIRIP